MEKEQSREILADCLHKLELIRNSFNYHKLPEMGKALGVYEGAAQQILDLTAQVQKQLTRLKGSI
jgi:hypothetical protein